MSDQSFICAACLNLIAVGAPYRTGEHGSVYHMCCLPEDGPAMEHNAFQPATTSSKPATPRQTPQEGSGWRQRDGML